ncbi:MAG: FAD-dependent oxidoreductase [Pseudomonadota bacterium]
MNNKVVVIGGGYAGIEVAHGLDKTADVTLIDRNPAFVHCSANIRALVDPTISKTNVIPYNNLLKRGKFVQGNVEHVRTDAVVLSDGRTIEADIIAVITGSTYATPFKPQGKGIDDLIDPIRTTHEKIAAASHIAIIGAGAVGTELAGEIRVAFPNKRVSLISEQPKLFPMYPEKLGAQLSKKLKQLGVDLMLGQRVKNLQTTNAPSKEPLMLDSGVRIDADLVIPAMGAKPNVGLLSELDGVELTSTGQVAVDQWLRPTSRNNLFVAGDIASTGDAMTITTNLKHVPFLVSTIKAVVAGKKVEQCKPYKGWNVVPLFLPLGPNLGNSILPIGKGWIVGDWLTSKIKGKELFIPKYLKLMGHIDRLGS